MRDGRLLGLEGMKEAPHNRGSLCARAHAAPEWLYSPQRLKLAVVGSGSGLAVQQAKDLANPKEPFDTLAQINQGGFHQTKKTIYDCQGNPYTLEVNFKKITENRWRWEAFLLDSEGKQVTGANCEDSTGGTSGNSSTIVPTPS